MKLDYLNIFQPQDAWVLHREKIYILEEICNVYMLLDAYFYYCFGQELSVDIISKATIINMITTASQQVGGQLPKQFLIAKNDPVVESLKQIGLELKIKIQATVVRPAIIVKWLIGVFLFFINALSMAGLTIANNRAKSLAIVVQLAIIARLAIGIFLFLINALSTVGLTISNNGTKSLATDVRLAILDK